MAELTQHSENNLKMVRFIDFTQSEREAELHCVSSCSLAGV